MRKIAVLGSTGSIGKQTLEVIEKNKDIFNLDLISSGGVTILASHGKRIRVMKVKITHTRTFFKYPHDDKYSSLIRL